MTRNITVKESCNGLHFKHQPQTANVLVITALLPLFYEKADMPIMTKHTMYIVAATTAFLRLGQIPVIACNCLIFAKYPHTSSGHRQQRQCIVLFGGLSIEILRMAMCTFLGDYLDNYNWITTLTEENIVTSDTAVF